MQSFEVGLIGGPAERWYRKARPEVEAMPWGTLPLGDVAPDTIARARRVWTMAAFQEYRTGAACTRALEHLFACSAPIDLIALCSRFPTDEIVHVELAARLLTELGGAVDLRYDPEQLGARPKPGPDALFRAAEQMMRVFCVGEAVSIPILRASWLHADIELIRAVLGRIVKDEAVHGEVGVWFFEWCIEAFDADERAALRAIAHDEVGKLIRSWERFRPAIATDESLDAHAGAYGLTSGEQGAGRLGWMPEDIYFATAHAALDSAVLEPLGRLGLDPREHAPVPGHP